MSFWMFIFSFAVYRTSNSSISTSLTGSGFSSQGTTIFFKMSCSCMSHASIACSALNVIMQIANIATDTMLLKKVLNTIKHTSASRNVRQSMCGEEAVSQQTCLGVRFQKETQP